MSGPVQMIDLVKIGTKDRERPDSYDHVTALANVMRQSALDGVGFAGLRVPIELREDGQGYIIISGLHRVCAANLLGWKQIAAFVLDVDEVTAKRLEVEENLIRHELNAIDKALHVRRFRELFEASYGAIKQGRPENRSNMDQLTWPEHAKERLGIGGTSLKRHLAIANNLAKASIERLRGTEWEDNQKALLELSALDTAGQAAALRHLIEDDNGIATIRDAIAALGGAPKREVPEADRWFLSVSSGFKKRSRAQQKRLARELIAADPDLFREVFADLGLVSPEADG